MNRLLTITSLFLFLFCLNSKAQQKYTISGYITDASSGETLIGANIFNTELKTGGTTNLYGFYSITLEEGTYNFVYSYIGYETQQFQIELNEDLTHSVSLSESGVMRDEIVIKGEREDKNIEGTEMGTVELSVDKIKKIPALLGEVDVLRTIQLLPGVMSAGEGNSGFYVRGGGPDQNLILLDEAIVYNPGHLFGFFSVFNSDAVKSATLTKGGMPARYGGRLSSVLDVSMKDGNTKDYHATGGIGLISSRLTLEGPLVKDKSAFMIAARRTYIDVLLQPLFNTERFEDFKGNGYYFYDLNTKLNYTFSEKDRIFLSGYFGRDVFNYRSTDGFEVYMPWGNATATLRWNHLFNNKLFMNATAIYNDYDFSVRVNSEINSFESTLFSGIRDYNLKWDFDYFPSVLHEIKFGVNLAHHTYTPYSVNAAIGDTEINSDPDNKKYALETAIYIQDEWSITDRIKVNVGLRASSFHHVGPYKDIRFGFNGLPEDTVRYDAFQFIADYYGIEPRISSRIRLNNDASVKLGFTYNNQYNHLVSSATSQLPTDLWVPSTARVKPQRGMQFSAGYFKNFADNVYEFSVEGYYKRLQNQIEFRESYAPELGIDIENDFVFGKGESYGLELFLKKRTGRFNGWAGYTLSRTTRTFPDINEGETFPARYDRTHDLSVVAIFELNEKWDFSGTYVYGTGQATTLPNSFFVIDGWIYTEYMDRNSFRMAPYHRMDFAATWHLKKRNKLEHDIVFSVYNVYNRQNPFFYYVDLEGDLNQGLNSRLIQVSLFPVLPSVTWNFKY